MLPSEAAVGACPATGAQYLRLFNTAHASQRAGIRVEKDVLASPTELLAAAQELDQGLRGAVVQQVYSPAALEVWLELRRPGRSTLLCVCARAGAERLAVADQRPESPKVASGFQQRLRKLLVGQRVEAVATDGVRLSANTLRTDFERHTLELGPAEAVVPREP